MTTQATPTKTRTKWLVDPSHSEVNFQVRHLMIANVKGEFQQFDAQIETIGTDFSHAKAQAQMKAASVFTNDENRDKHLKSADFFDAEVHPQLSFKSTSMEHVRGNNYKLKGDLTIKDITKPVTLDVEFGGTITDPSGKEKAGFSLSGRINRKDWGLNWNSALESGGVLVGDEVRISGEMQFVKQ